MLLNIYLLQDSRLINYSELKKTYIGACVLSLLSHQDVKQLALPQQEVSCDVDTMWPARGQYASTASCTVGCDPGGLVEANV